MADLSSAFVSSQCLVQILDELLRGLDPDGHANEIIADSDGDSLLGCQSRVRRARGSCQQGLYTPQTRSDGGDRDAFEEFFGAVRGALQLKAQHPPKPFEQRSRARVPRVTFQTGVVHARNGRVALEKSRDLEGAAILMPYPQGERFQPTAQQKRRMRIHGAAEVVQLVRDPLDYRRARGNHTANDIRMAVQVFRRTVQADVEP